MSGHRTQPGHAHVDLVKCSGPFLHIPNQSIFHIHDPLLGVVPAVAVKFKPRAGKARRDNEIQMQSRDLDHDGNANILEFRCSPPKVLQGHNLFGHADIQDYCYRIADGQAHLHGFRFGPEDRYAWYCGHVKLLEVHLTANFFYFGDKRKLFDAIDANHPNKKQRPLSTWIILGGNERGRSVHHMVTIYDKEAEMRVAWGKDTKLGPLQLQLLELARQTIRVEVKLYPQGLSHRNLKYAYQWADVDPDEVFFSILNKYSLTNTFQQAPSPVELKLLTAAETRTYQMWQMGGDISQICSRTTEWKHRKVIMEKLGVDIRAERRPDENPLIDLRQVFSRENIMPIPDGPLREQRYCESMKEASRNIVAPFARYLT